jgi:predicted flap endonuclease-1-like 5' DNA nuclease
MFRNIGFCSSKDKSFSWWWLGVKIGVVTALIVWWWLENKGKKYTQKAPAKEPRDEIQSIPLPTEDTPPGEAPLAEAVQAETPEPPATPPTEPDDLTKIEGIGPKINAALQEAGIRTYLQLADAKPAAIKQILSDAGIRIGFPDTWPEQAALAAKADWSALKALQSSLQGGRRAG